MWHLIEHVPVPIFNFLLIFRRGFIKVPENLDTRNKVSTKKYNIYKFTKTKPIQIFDKIIECRNISKLKTKYLGIEI